MRIKSTLFSLLLVCGISQSPPLFSQNQVTHWEHDNAVAAVQSVNIDRAVYEIRNISTLADGKATLNKLRQLETRHDWPVPAREAAIYQFTRSLADLPRDAVATEVIQYLQDYQAMTLVPHEDHADAFVPLFNIRSAAKGVENSWQRADFAITAEHLLKSDPTELLGSYLKSTNHNQQIAYLDVLKYAGPDDLVTVQLAALKQFDTTPRLTPVIGITAVRTADIYAAEQLLIHGRGAGLSSTFAQLGARLPYSEMATLLTFAIEQAPASNASLAIAAWWPKLRHDAETRDLLMEILAEPSLGAAAALALAQNPDVQTIKMLQDTASADSKAARRAQMALDFNRDRLLGGNKE